MQNGDTKVRLWTFQPHGLVQHDISARGSYHAVRALSSFHDEPMFQDAYSWMIRQMSTHHVMKSRALRHDTSTSPIWFYARWRGENGDILEDIHDMRCEHDFDWAEDMDMIVVDIPEERILLTDFDDYHCVLNGICLMTEEQWEQYERQGSPDISEDDIRKSWDGAVISPSSMSDHDYVQATVWDIRRTDIIAIIPKI
jgi:hypothetical protein